MSDLDVLRVPEAKTEPEKKTELDRDWWCRTFHDRYMVTIILQTMPVRVCRKCVITERSM